MKRLDLIDHEHLVETFRTSGWAIFLSRIQCMLEHARHRLEDPTDFDTTQTTRGYIRALRDVLDLPKQLLIESERPKRQ